MILGESGDENDFRFDAGREGDRLALQTTEGEFVLKALRGERRRAHGGRFAGEAMIGTEKLPAVRAVSEGAGRAGEGEPRTTAFGHRLILAGENDVSELGVGDREQVDVLRDVGLVVADGGFVGETEILRVEQVERARTGARVAHLHAPAPSRFSRAKTEGGGALERTPSRCRLPGSGVAVTAKIEAGADEWSPAHRRALSLKPAEDQAKQSILSGAGQQLIQQRVAVSQRVERTGGKKLSAQARRAGEFQQLEISGGAEASGRNVSWTLVHEPERET